MSEGASPLLLGDLSALAPDDVRPSGASVGVVTAEERNGPTADWWVHLARTIAAIVLRFPIWVLVAIAAFGILTLRRPDVLTNAQFYAEDGRIFYLGALLDGPSGLFRSYAGYLALVPRLVALAETAVPVAWAPSLANTISFVIAAGIAAYVSSKRLALVLRGRWLRAATGLTFALLPATHEVFGTMTNVQWLLGAYLVLAVAQTDPTSRLEAVADRSALAVASLSGPMSIVAAPLYVARLIRRRDRTSAWMASAVLAPAATQLFVLAHSGRPVGPTSQSDLLTIGAVAVYRAFIVPLAGVHVGGWLTQLPIPHLLQALGAVVLVAVVVAVLCGLGSRGWGVAYVITAFTGLAFIATPYPAGVFLDAWAGARYFFLPGAVLAGSALANLGQGHIVSRIAAVACVLVLVVGIVGDFALPPRDLHGWAASSACIGGSRPCDVAIDQAGKWTIHWPGQP